MAAGRVSAIEAVDDAADLVRRTLTPWLGVFWLTAMPLRFMQVLFVRELFALPGPVNLYGNYLRSLAYLTTAAFIVALAGRAVYCRALNYAQEGGSNPGWEVFRIHPGGMASYLAVGMLIELLYFATAWTLFALPVFAVPAGIAAVVVPRRTRPEIAAPIKSIAGYMRNTGTLVLLVLVFTVVVLIAWINLAFLVLFLLWLARGLTTADLSAWETLLRSAWPMFPVYPAELLPRLLFMAATALFVEPFWLAAMSAYVMQCDETRTGRDLLRWFRRINPDAAATPRRQESAR